MKKKIILRADGNSMIGFGHIYRVLALADILKADFDCRLVTATPGRLIQNEFQKIGIPVIPLPTIEYPLPGKRKKNDEIAFDLAKILSGDEIVVTDGYWFGEKYQKAVKKANCKLICIDDLAEWNFVSDVVINHAPDINKVIYHKNNETILLTGLDYLLVRPAFFKNMPEQGKTFRVLVAMGGSDYYKLSLKLTLCLLKVDPSLPIEVLVTGAFDPEHIKKLDELRNKGNLITIHKELTAQEVVSLFDNCSHAIVSSSTILLEAFSRGIKAATGFYVNNQKNIYKGMVSKGFAFGLGNLSKVKDIELETMVKEYLEKVTFKSTNQINKVSNNFRKLFNELANTNTLRQS